jgi:hypothetical protein
MTTSCHTVRKNDFWEAGVVSTNFPKQSVEIVANVSSSADCWPVWRRGPMTALKIEVLPFKRGLYLAWLKSA